MNPFAAISWFWRAWRARSVTFAALFVFGLFGVSVLGWFRRLLSHLGAPWFIWLLVPLAVVSALARKEAEWMPDPAQRRKWALRLIVGSIVLILLVARFAPRRGVERAPPLATPPGAGGRADPPAR